MEISEYVTCYVCEKGIPKAYFEKHTRSTIHECNSYIMDVALERSRKIIKANDACTKASKNSHSTVKSIYYNNLTNSERHKLRMYEEILPKICILYKDAENNLNVLDEIRNILNKLDIAPVRNESVKTAAEGKTYCDVCNVYKSNVGFKGHLKSKTHKYNVKANGFADTVQSKATTNLVNNTLEPGKTYCDICKVYKGTISFKFHLMSKTHISNCKANNLPLPIVEGHKYCDICSIYNMNEFFDSHINSENHKLKAKVNSDVKVKNKNIAPSVKIINEHAKYIDIKDDICICKLCKDILDNNDDTIKKHLDSNKHCLKYINIINNNNITKVRYEYFCPKCDVFFDDITEHLKTHENFIDFDQFCDVCNVRVPAGGFQIHNTGKNHTTKMEKASKQIDNYINVDLKKIKERNQISVKYKALVCKVCDVPLSDVDTSKHFEEGMHTVNMYLFASQNGLVPARSDLYFCTICKKHIERNWAYDHVATEHKV